MNKSTSTAASFQRKPYAKPQMKVVEIKGADIICTSTEPLQEEDFIW